MPAFPNKTEEINSIELGTLSRVNDYTGVWIGNWIYLTVKTLNYKSL
jgi:hypothetical protein